MARDLVTYSGTCHTMIMDYSSSCDCWESTLECAISWVVAWWMPGFYIFPDCSSVHILENRIVNAEHRLNGERVSSCSGCHSPSNHMVHASLTALIYMLLVSAEFLNSFVLNLGWWCHKWGSMPYILYVLWPQEDIGWSIWVCRPNTVASRGYWVTSETSVPWSVH